MKKTITAIFLSLVLLTLASCGHEHTPVLDNAVAPTCTQAGLTEGSHCSECGEVLTAQEEIAKLEHTAVVDEAVAPTCTQAGLTEGSHCSECGEVLTAQEEVAKLEHTAVVDEAVAPTCIATGLTEGSHCSECGEVLTTQEEVAKLEHTAVVDEAVAPTCTAAGLTEGSHCSECGEVLTAQEEVAKLEHTAVLGGEEIAPSCNKAGRSSYTICSVCKVRITEPQTIPTIDHQYRYNYYDTASHQKICTAGCGQTSLENHSFDSANKCKCRYTKFSAAVGTKDVVTSIAKNDVAIFNEMSDYSKSADLSRYMEKSKVNGWAPTRKGNCNTRVKEFSWLDTNGFAIVEVDADEKAIKNSYILLQSNTTDPDYVTPLIWRDLNDINSLYGVMGSEVTIALDTFLESLGEYDVIDYIIKENGKYVSKGSDNALVNFKNIISVMTTFIKEGNAVPIIKYRFYSSIIVRANGYEYTITANSSYDYKTFKVANAVNMTWNCQ
ncbi:MAG: hypothetical protein IJA67_03980 [Oscillospiraceae bacterium]|nr:hypothetical protein [Oscillospiraceae bacterium]